MAVVAGWLAKFVFGIAAFMHRRLYRHLWVHVWSTMFA